MAMNSSIKNSRLLITGTLLHHKHQLRDFFNRYDWLQQLPRRPRFRFPRDARKAALRSGGVVLLTIRLR